ncbi:MAG: hypothetical protein JOZ15_00450 [Acidobacteria bacterium]|nr:hypothetical protein [Acidobacteriota bacterium]
MPSPDDRHLDATDVAELLAMELSPVGSRRIVGHLLAGCGLCRARIHEHQLRLGQGPKDFDAAFDVAFDAAFDAAFDTALARSAGLIGARLAELEAGARLWCGLRDLPAGRRLLIVRNSRKHRTAGVLEALLRDYREELWRESRLGEEIADLGLLIAERLDASRYPASALADLRGQALAIAANARRLAWRPGEAEQLLRQAARQLSLGSGDLLLEAELRNYQGSHRQALGRFEEAARAFQRAEHAYRTVGEPHLAARSLVARAEAIGYLNPERGIRLIRRAIPDIDGDRDPYLELAAHHSLAWYLNDSGQGWEARLEVGRSAGLYQRFSGDAVASLSRAWLQGRIDRSLRELDQARRSYERAWAGFEELGMQIHLTMLAIDRAELRVAGGEPGSAAALLARTLLLLRSWGISRDTLAALRLLRAAVVGGRCGRAAFRQASLVVRRSWAQAGTPGAGTASC